jgi:integrase
LIGGYPVAKHSVFLSEEFDRSIKLIPSRDNRRALEQAGSRALRSAKAEQRADEIAAADGIPPEETELGRNWKEILFDAAARLTPDVLEDYRRRLHTIDPKDVLVAAALLGDLGPRPPKSAAPTRLTRWRANARMVSRVGAFFGRFTYGEISDFAVERYWQVCAAIEIGNDDKHSDDPKYLSYTQTQADLELLRRSLANYASSNKLGYVPVFDIPRDKVTRTIFLTRDDVARIHLGIRGRYWDRETGGCIESRIEMTGEEVNDPIHHEMEKLEKEKRPERYYAAGSGKTYETSEGKTYRMVSRRGGVSGGWLKVKVELDPEKEEVATDPVHRGRLDGERYYIKATGKTYLSAGGKTCRLVNFIDQQTLKLHKGLARVVILEVYAGARHQTCIGMRWDPSKNYGRLVPATKTVHRGLYGQPKSSKTMSPVSPMAPRLVQHSTRWEKRDRKLGFNAIVRKYDTGTYSTVTHQFNHVVEAAGLDPEIVLHTFRHTLATWLCVMGVDIHSAAAFLGMSIGTLDKVYRHFSEANAQNAVDVWHDKEKVARLKALKYVKTEKQESSGPHDRRAEPQRPRRMPVPVRIQKVMGKIRTQEAMSS